MLCRAQSNTFLSTSPAWGTTAGIRRLPGRCRYFYPRPPRGGRQQAQLLYTLIVAFLSTSPAWGTTVPRCICRSGAGISIHVPRVGDDLAAREHAGQNQHFYPRPPRGGRLPRMRKRAPRMQISIHVPRVGDDARMLSCAIHVGNFYPRPPRGGRPYPPRSPAFTLPFLSTSPAWGTTQAQAGQFRRFNISIHVPRVGDDRPRCQPPCPGRRYFYPRPPRGGRR